MPKLTRLLETSFNSNYTPGGVYVAYQTSQIYKLEDATPAGTHSVMLINKLDGSQPDSVGAASAATAVLAAINTANTTDIGMIAVTVIPRAGSNYSQYVPVAYIHKVTTDALNASRSYIALQDLVNQQMFQLHVEESVSDVVTAANA